MLVFIQSPTSFSELPTIWQHATLLMFLCQITISLTNLQRKEQKRKTQSMSQIYIGCMLSFLVDSPSVLASLSMFCCFCRRYGESKWLYGIPVYPKLIGKSLPSPWTVAINSVPPKNRKHKSISLSWWIPILGTCIRLYSEKKSLKPSISGWWLGHPSEKWWSSSIGMMISNPIFLGKFQIDGNQTTNQQPVNHPHWVTGGPLTFRCTPAGSPRWSRWCHVFPSQRPAVPPGAMDFCGANCGAVIMVRQWGYRPNMN